MTIVRMKVTCPFCGKEYSFNPSVGKGLCPRCEKRRRSDPQSLTMDESVSGKLLKGGPVRLQNPEVIPEWKLGDSE